MWASVIALNLDATVQTEGPAEAGSLQNLRSPDQISPSVVEGLTRRTAVDILRLKSDI